MDHSGWYGGQTHHYHLQEPPAAPASAHLHNAAAAPPPAHYQQPPPEPFKPFPPSSSTAAAAISAQYPYHPHSHPPNPNPVPSRLEDPPPAGYHLYEPPPSAAAGALQPPDLDAYALEPYGSYMGYNGHSAAQYGYPTVGAASYHHVLPFSAKDAIRQYGVDPGAYGNILRRPPDFSMHYSEATHPRYGTRRKDKKIAKVVQSAYCNVCKVDCNTQEVLISHRQGKKHKKNLEKLKESIVPKPAKVLTAASENKETTDAEEDKTASEQTKTTDAEKDTTASEQTKKKSAPATEVDLETKKRRLLEEGATADAMRVCTICNIVCNSEVVFNYHVAGQKHAAMVKKQAASTS